MVDFTHTNTRFTVLPQNAQAYREALDKPTKHKFLALSSFNLKRSYPKFFPGMSTADYVRVFNVQFDGMQHPIKHDCANYYETAPMLDAAQPEVLEELDPDYVPDFLSTTTKAKKQTVASLKASITEALALLARGDVDMAQCVLSESLK
jgi:hypothetical protein